MSLRLRLVLAITFVLTFTLIAGSALVYWHALGKVDTEMQAALAVGIRTVQNATDDAEEATNPLRHLELLIADFDGDRHLRAFLMDNNGVAIAKSMLLVPAYPAPAWFNSLLAREPDVAQLNLPLPFARYGSIILTTDSHNEIEEVWSDFLVTLVILAIFCTLVLALIYFTMGWPLRLVRSLSTAFSRIGSGDYSPRIRERGAPELIELSNGFNEMATRLSVMKAENRQLQNQLAMVQDEERADLARDLHDEVGPLLFALSIDLSTIRNQDWRASNDKILTQLDTMASTIGEMQLHVRSMLGKLRPAILLDLGLSYAVTNLVEFWSRRHENIRISFYLESETFGEGLDAVIYRVIQEALNNALRHGHPSAVDIKAHTDQDGFVEVEVSDNGSGLSAPSADFGFGLTGMKERVESAGGMLEIVNRRDGRGVLVHARLPRYSDEQAVEEDVT